MRAGSCRLLPRLLQHHTPFTHGQAPGLSCGSSSGAAIAVGRRTPPTRHTSPSAERSSLSSAMQPRASTQAVPSAAVGAAVPGGGGGVSAAPSAASLAARASPPPSTPAPQRSLGRGTKQQHVASAQPSTPVPLDSRLELAAGAEQQHQAAAPAGPSSKKVKRHKLAYADDSTAADGLTMTADAAAAEAAPPDALQTPVPQGRKRGKAAPDTPAAPADSAAPAAYAMVAPATVVAAAAVAPPAAGKPQQRKRKQAERPVAADGDGGELMQAADAGGGDSAAAAGRRTLRPRRSTSAASDGGSSKRPARRSRGAAAAAGDGDEAAEAAAAPSAAAAAAAGGDEAAGAANDAAPSAAAAATRKTAAKKPPRRTKKVVAAEVVEAARQGQFGALTSLTDAYSHVALFQNGNTTAAWQQLMQPAAAAAPGIQQQQDQQDQHAAGMQLCRASGLGSYKQQVWLLSGQPQPRQQQAAALTPEQRAQQLKVLPNLGYACLCSTMRKYEVFASRDCVKKTRFGPGGLDKVSELALLNARDLVPLVHWNEAHGIRFFRLSSCIFPWMTSYALEDLPDWPAIQQALRSAGDLAKRLGHRLTFHPSEYCKIAGEREEWVTQSVAELEVHSRMFDEMGFLPATPHNKINIHVGGAYGDPDGALQRFSQVVNTRLSANCKARLTVENDDRPNLFSVADLLRVHDATGIPIVFDFHHHQFCTGGQTQSEAFHAAIGTWPQGVRPVVHHSECPEDPRKMRKAHSEFIDGPINLFGEEGSVDVMIEAKAKELTLLAYRQWAIDGFAGPGPRTRREAELLPQLAAAKAAADAAAAAAAAEEEDDSENQGCDYDSE